MKMEVWKKDFKNKGWEKAEINIHEIISDITEVDTKITHECWQSKYTALI